MKETVNKVKIKSLTIRDPQSAIHNSQGFTLIEMAMVMIVIGLLVGLGATVIGPLMKQYKYTQSRGIIDAAKESAISYAAGNNYIPDNTGGASDFTQVVTESKDAFSRSLYYIADNSLFVTGGNEVCERGTTGLIVQTCPDAACGTPTNVVNDVAFVVVSGGANFNTQTDNAAGAVNVYEQDTPGVDDYDDGSGKVPDNYDDIVKWVTLNELKTKAGCLGAPLKILNNELPSGSITTAYSATIYADGGVRFTTGNDYKWCIDSATAFPTGIANPASCGAPADCSALANDEGLWLAATGLTISGTITAGVGTYLIPIFVRDDNDGSGLTGNDSCAAKSFVLTINP